MGAAGERPQFDIKPPSGAPLLIFPRGYRLTFFLQGEFSARRRRFEVSSIALLGELLKAIKPHMPVCQSYRLQLGPTMWTSPMTK